MPRIMVPYPRACGDICTASCIYCHILLLMLCIYVWNSFYPHTSLATLREFLAGFHEDDRKSTSGGCFSVLVISNLSMRTSFDFLYMLDLGFGIKSSLLLLKIDSLFFSCDEIVHYQKLP
jgi:hypothetical protein